MQNRGFTLIELLVVVLIIGILTAVALPQYQKAVAKAEAAEAMVLLDALATGEQIYIMANGKVAPIVVGSDTFFKTVEALDVSMPPAEKIKQRWKPLIGNNSDSDTSISLCSEKAPKYKLKINVIAPNATYPDRIRVSRSCQGAFCKVISNGHQCAHYGGDGDPAWCYESLTVTSC